MQINITFFVQFFNICLTMWFLRRFFWTPLLGIVLRENQQEEAIIKQKIHLEKTIACDADAFHKEQAAIIEKIHTNLVKIHKNKHPKKCIESELATPNKPAQNTVKIQSDARSIVTLIQEKFG
jgi:hypothetical protein